jgi:hypothetical protein
MLGFMTFRCARILLGGIELMHMIAKGQMKDSGSGQTRAEKVQFVGDISIPHHAGPVFTLIPYRQNQHFWLPTKLVRSARSNC